MLQIHMIVGKPTAGEPVDAADARYAKDLANEMWGPNWKKFPTNWGPQRTIQILR